MMMDGFDSVIAGVHKEVYLITFKVQFDCQFF